eukprot:TRINITY_DN4506_c0_g1_i6.p1 TRINITY_DN4506_c0_g1~~TRINITY_DN4506_c0_g1_i6.p1  ORF type:complete len:402 (-),score=64.60 TRINITY_DN4506_c0_g1_i6:206-1411(-)
MKRYRVLIFLVLCFQFTILYLTQFFSPQFIQSMVLVGENNIYNIFKAEKQFILNGSISLVAKKSNESNVTDIKLDINGEFFPSIMTSDSNGRLGNQLCAYATLLYFQKVHGFHAILNEGQVSAIGSIFQEDKIEISASRINMPPQINFNWESVASHTPQGAWFPNEEFLENIEKYKYNKLINIGMYPHYLFLFKSIVGHIKKNLLFKNQTQALVDQWLAELREETSSEKEIIFVGVHCRRTDYGWHMESLAGATMVDHTYFDKAFDIYRSRYNTDSSQVVFLAVSDDQAWIKANLGKHSDVRFGLDFSQGQIEDAQMPGFDLCLLASCDHSIHTYGTFGMWGSLLAGGDVIATTGTTGKEEATTEEDQIYRRAAMENWVYLDVRDKDNIQEVTISPSTSAS